MNRYDYKQEVYNDIESWVNENIDMLISRFADDDHDFANVKDWLNEELWANDSVTGNGSGSYTFNTWTAEENLCHNWDLLEEAIEEFGDRDADIIDKGAEWCDVTIRCYLLSACIEDYIDSEDFSELWNSKISETLETEEE